jgi:2-polyprenyl-3-methyl-5-hydroxy-6-metoxy-1,4-benzoquinol methylase
MVTCSARLMTCGVAIVAAVSLFYVSLGADFQPLVSGGAAEQADTEETPATTTEVAAFSQPASQAPASHRSGALSPDMINPVRGADPVAVGPLGLTCPSYRFRGSKSADGKHTHEAMVKYTRYVKQYCNATGMLQMHLDLATYIRFLDTVALMAKLKPNDVIFDWGSGCGTMLNYYAMKYNTTGVGIDVTEAAVQHARTHGRDGQLFCFMDGADLRHFPSGSFDAIVTWATLYHVRRTLVQCDIVHQFVRMLKPGGIAYVGHLRTEKTQEYWKKGKCRPPNATVVRRSDAKTFHMASFRRNNFFSLVVTKDAATKETIADTTTEVAEPN